MMREHESATSLAPPNNALHLTKRVGVPALRAVVEARFAVNASVRPTAEMR
jgi:hypothetical protein